jgi:hypothetical protein
MLCTHVRKILQIAQVGFDYPRRDDGLPNIMLGYHEMLRFLLSIGDFITLNHPKVIVALIRMLIYWSAMATKQACIE